MVEASMILPIVILCVISLIYIMTGMYQQAAVSAKLHMTLLREAGNARGTYSTEREISDYTPIDPYGRDGFAASIKISRKNELLKDIIVGNAADYAKGKGIINKIVKRKYIFEIYVIDEEEYIRCLDIANGIVKEAVQ